MSATAVFKTCMAVILAGGCMVAAFYAGYILILLLVLTIVAGISAAVFSWKEKADAFDFHDWDDY